MREPEARRVERGGWAVWLLVLAATGAGALLAPDAWPRGPATLHVTAGDQHTLREPVDIGDETPRSWEAGTTQVELPDGVGTDRNVEVLVRGIDSLTDATVELVLEDGRREVIPAVRYDPDTGTVSARRRPVGQARPVLAVLGAVVVLWVTEGLSLWLASLIVPAALVVSGVLDADRALAPFFHPIIVLFFAGFLLAEAMRRVGLDRTLATRLVAVAGRGPVTLFAGFVGLAATLSMFMSNTAAVAVLIPIAMAVTDPLEDVGYRRTIVLGTAYAATIGGVGSAIGTPANPLAITFLEDVAGRTVTFLGWFAFGLPMVLLFVPLMAAYLWWRMRPTVDPTLFGEVTARARASAHGAHLDRPQLHVLVVFAAVVAGWVTEPLHGVHIGIVALIGVIVLAATGRIETPDLGRISWAALLTFGGGLTLGIALTEVGMSDWVATRLGALSGLPGILGVAVVAGTALALTTVASNTAAAAIFVPLAIPLAAVLHVDPVLLVVAVAIATSIDFALVIGTPPTMLAYSTGLYTPLEVLRLGGVLDLAGLVLLVGAVTGIWRVTGLVT